MMALKKVTTLLAGTAVILSVSTQASTIFLFDPVAPLKPAYFSALFGYSNVNYTNGILREGYVAQKIQNSGTAIKVSLGYDFSRYCGAEFGIIYFKKPSFTGIPNVLDNPKTIKNNVIYLAAKLNIPLGNHFFAVGKGGLGYIARNGITTVGNITILQEGEIVRPVYGAGLGWVITPHWVIEANWLQAASSSSRQLPLSNFYGLGFQYRFQL